MGHNLQVWNDAEYVHAEFPHNPLVEDGILDKFEKLLIAGPSESGKSYLALQWAFELASKGNWFGWEVVERSKVLLCQAEVSNPRYQERYLKLRTSYPEAPLPLAVVTTEEMKLDTEGGAEIFGLLIADTRPQVVVLDPLRAFFAGDENSSEHAEKWFTSVANAQAIHPFTLMLVHHVTKPVPGYESDELSKWAIRGSGLWTDRPSTIVGLTCNSTQTKWVLNFLKTRNRHKHPDALHLAVDAATGLFIPHDDINPSTMYVSYVMDVLGGKERKQKDVVKALMDQHKISMSAARIWINKAVERELVTQTAAGGAGAGYLLIPHLPSMKGSG